MKNHLLLHPMHAPLGELRVFPRFSGGLFLKGGREKKRSEEERWEEREGKRKKGKGREGEGRICHCISLQNEEKDPCLLTKKVSCRSESQCSNHTVLLLYV